MMIKISEAVNSIKFFFVCCLFFCGYSSKGQCVINNELGDYNLNLVYTLDSLAVDDEFVPLLDHAIAILDTFQISKDSTWLFYIISLNSEFSENYGLGTKISLRQGERGNPLFYEIPAWEDYLSGGFCYKGYTFLVLLNPRNEPFFNKIFHYQGCKKEFSLYYKTPLRCKLGIEIDQDIFKYTILYYSFRNNKYQYILTDFNE